MPSIVKRIDAFSQWVKKLFLYGGRMKRFTLLTKLMLLSISLLLLFSLASCEPNQDYTITIEGIGPEAIEITKSQILNLSETKSVVYDQDNPCYASDKTDDDNNLIPRILKGVYLDDILEVYAHGVVSGSFSAMTIKAADGYETVLTSDTYNPEHGGSKMIIAFEYEGIVLNESESSGALRAVFPDQPANSWVKGIKTIIFSDAALTPPAPSKINFLELLGDDYNGSFETTRTVGENTQDYIYYGISIDKLLEEGILEADEEDKMYLIAWDYITDGTSSFYREYTNWKSWEYYANSYLTYQCKIGEGEIEDLGLAPILDGANIQKGMSVKNTLAITVSSTALITLDIAYERFDLADEGKIDIIDILDLVNMYDEEGEYVVFDTNDQEYNLTSETLSQAELVNEEGVYTLHYGEDSTLIIKSIIKQ